LFSSNILIIKSFVFELKTNHFKENIHNSLFKETILPFINTCETLVGLYLHFKSIGLESTYDSSIISSKVKSSDVFFIKNSPDFLSKLQDITFLLSEFLFSNSFHPLLLNQSDNLK
jgi:hypothetical protein